MPKKTIQQLDLSGRRIFIRVDFNVPIHDGVISDDTRIRAALPTLNHAQERGATVVIGSHLGRPKGTTNPKLSLQPIANRLGKLLKRPVVFSPESVGAHASRVVAEAKPGDVVLLENLRFHPGEEANDKEYAAALANLADCYVNDAFGAAHRAHASTVGIVQHLREAAAGLLMADELAHLGTLLDTPPRPFVAVLGGAKVSGKLEVIENLIGKVDTLLVGGAMAYTFFKAKGLPVGRSLIENAYLDTVRAIEKDAINRAIDLELPLDHRITDKLTTDASYRTIDVHDPSIGQWLGADIGPSTVTRYTAILRRAKTIFWNGPMGVFEIDSFASGTVSIAKAVATSLATSVVGGGDSVAAIGRAGVRNQISHISTGGGASLEFLGGRKLPGIDALPDTNTTPVKTSLSAPE
ncbi:MAG: phosphoglycerate kinase [Acidobacteria bacterium]|nr:phosphoglycerate kinase [Acidobacteriota bacterium]